VEGGFDFQSKVGFLVGGGSWVKFRPDNFTILNTLIPRIKKGPDLVDDLSFAS
jgi:hypothetical protein